MRWWLWVLAACTTFIALIVVGSATRDGTQAPISCVDCEIYVTTELSLGTPDDTLGLPGLVRLTTASDGRILAVSDMASLEPPLMYSADGELLGHLGARGSGPGEFGAPIRLASSPGGPLVVYDHQTGVHVFTGEGEFERRLTPGLPIPQPFRNPVIVADTLLAIAARTRSSATPTRPIEFYDLRTGRHVASTGPPSEFDAQSGSDHVPDFASGCRDGVWVISDGLTTTHWTTQGVEGAGIPVEGERLVAVTEWAGIPADDIMTRNVWQDCETGLIWIAAQMRDPREYEAPEVEPGQPLDPDFSSPSYQNRTHNTLILTLDPDAGEVVAAGAIDQVVTQFLPDGRVVTVHEWDDGYQEVLIHSLELRAAS